MRNNHYSVVVTFISLFRGTECATPKKNDPGSNSPIKLVIRFEGESSQETIF